MKFGREASDAAGERPDRLNEPEVAPVLPRGGEREKEREPLHSRLIVWEHAKTKVIWPATTLGEVVHPPYYYCLWYMSEASLWQVGFCSLGRFETPIRGGEGGGVNAMGVG